MLSIQVTSERVEKESCTSPHSYVNPGIIQMELEVAS